MTLEDFKATLAAAAPPPVAAPLQALWHDARGDWEEAHRITQDIDTADAAWVHAYLHRKEGDLSNAAYWYRHAFKPVAHDSLDDEWEQIVRTFLSR